MLFIEVILERNIWPLGAKWERTCQIKGTVVFPLEYCFNKINTSHDKVHDTNKRETYDLELSCVFDMSGDKWCENDPKSFALKKITGLVLLMWGRVGGCGHFAENVFVN